MTEKEARKVQKENRQAAKKLQYQEILKRNLANATRKNTQCQSQPLKQPSKKRRTPSGSTSGSESDSLCSRRELEQAIKDKEKWKKRARHFEAEITALTKQVTTLQECLRSEIFRLEKQVEAGKGVPGIARSQPWEPIREDAFQCLSPSPSIEMEDPFQQGQDVYMPKQTQEGASTAEAQDVQVPRPAEQEGAAVSTLQRREGELPSHSSAVPCPAQDFSYLANGSFHLSKGVVISAVQAKKILANKKPTLVCKDTAHAIWGPEELAKRSVSGIVAPRKKHSGELPKKALSPGKVDVIKGNGRKWESGRVVHFV